MQPARTIRLESRAPTLTSQCVQRYGIVGQSRAIAEVIRRIELVSATRSTVLITGETGTGKELMARAVHDRSARRTGRSLGQLRSDSGNLLESELFGHSEARSPALRSVEGEVREGQHRHHLPGRDREMSTDRQVKLLRVLEDREIQRLGAGAE